MLKNLKNYARKHIENYRARRPALEGRLEKECRKNNTLFDCDRVKSEASQEYNSKVGEILKYSMIFRN